VATARGSATSRPARARRQVERLAHSPRAEALLLWLSFLEAIILPVPLEAVLVPYMLLRRDRIWRIATIALIGFILASVLGYLLAMVAFNSLGIRLIDLMGWQEPFAAAKSMVRAHGFWAIVLIGLTPIPTQIAMLVGGAFAFPIPLFLVAMGISRGIRYYGLAALIAWLGPQASQAFGRLQSLPKRRRQLLKAGLIITVLGFMALIIWLTT
jgi:membrane protein YqaA with SNARE-associated domain